MCQHVYDPTLQNNFSNNTHNHEIISWDNFQNHFSNFYDCMKVNKKWCFNSRCNFGTYKAF